MRDRTQPSGPNLNRPTASWRPLLLWTVTLVVGFVLLLAGISAVDRSQRDSLRAYEAAFDQGDTR